MPPARSAAARPSDGMPRRTGSHERHRVSNRTVRIEHEQVVRRSRRPRVAERGETAERPPCAAIDALVAVENPRSGARAVAPLGRVALVGRIGEQDDVAGRLAPSRPTPASDSAPVHVAPPNSKPAARIRSGEDDVVDDHLRRRAREDSRCSIEWIARGHGQRPAFGSRLRSEYSSISTSAMSWRAARGCAVCVSRQS